MVLSSTGPPGLPRPKKPLSPSSLLPQAPSRPDVLSPVPMQPHASWFQLLPPSPGPAPFTLPTAAYAEPAQDQPHAELASSMRQLPCAHTDNSDIIVNLTSSAESNLHLGTSSADPWTRAHMRACAHAKDTCAACSISLTCCSCRSLRYTPGPPPTSPMPRVHRSRSTSPVLFRDVGNGTPPATPPGLYNTLDYDDDAYARTFAELDTCDNSSCPRGTNEPATWTITVEHFDDGTEEFYDRTFRACGNCNRSCKKTFMTHRIKSRTFDNSTRHATVEPVANVPPTETLSTPPPEPSQPPTPLEIFATVSYAHNVSCTHAFTTCSACSLGIICCGCNKLHTAPARLRLRCTACSHYACATCTMPFCCSCRKPWFPSDSPTLVLASRFRGGARSTKSSKKGSSSSSQLSGPGSLATAHSARNSPDPFIGPDPQLKLTQSSTDEINAFVDNTVRFSAVAGRDNNAPTVMRSTGAPSPSSNLPSAPGPVFSRPEALITTGTAEDLPTAVPTRAPSRAASIASVSSTGNAGIGELLQLDPAPIPADPPALSDIVGCIHRRYPLASLKVDDDDSRHFLARDNTRIDDIANETEYLLSSNSSWPSILYFIRDTLKFESIQGSLQDFQVLMAGLAEIWSDAAEFDARTALHDMVEGVRLLPKAEKEIDRLEDVAACYRKERQAARTQLKTTEVELSRLRQAANDTLDSNARLLAKIDQLQATDAITIARERDEAQSALNDAIAHSKSAMAKQVSRYQHLASIAEERNSRLQELEKEAVDKDTYILKTEREHAEVYREREAAERVVTTLKQQLQDATSLFETAREARRHDQEDFNERAAAFKQHISELNARLNLLPSGEAELRSLAALANECAGIAEEEYRKKSAELKLVHKELAALKAKQGDETKSKASTSGDIAKSTQDTGRKAIPKGQADSSKKVRWSFEPADDSSQPFWDHHNEYSRYIASMVTATVTALPNIPMQTVISTAIETVRAAGPTIFSSPTTAPGKTPSRSSSPKPTGNLNPRNLPANTAPKNKDSAASAKGSKSNPIEVASAPSATATFAQVAASVLNPPVVAPVHPAKSKPTWRAVETNKSLVLRLGTKGTRVSELHIRVPKVPSTTHLFSLSGTKLINEILRLVNDSHDKEGIRALKDNHLVLVKWSMRGNLIVKCSKPMDDTIKNCLHNAIKAAVPPSSADSITILNKPPTTALKFMTVPRHNEDGSDTDSFDLYNDLMAHELWRDVELFSQPRFLPMKDGAAGGMVIVSVVDDNQGTVGRKLMNTVVSFSGASRRCLRWVEKEAQLFCIQCQCWGHLNYNYSTTAFATSVSQEKESCACRSATTAMAPISHLAKTVFSTSIGLVKNDRSSCAMSSYKNGRRKPRPLISAANSDSGRATRVATAIKIDKGKAKAKTASKPPKEDDDFVPVGRGGKAKYTFGGMAQALANTTRIDEVKDNDDKSDASSELRLSYLDDLPLKQRFPALKPPAIKPPAVPTPLVTETKPLTIVLPAPGERKPKPLHSVTDIL
ncbi:hypothetical protein AX14_001175 [Amanita brunnescens Koide BX004]|nr:hypothetical protein AX14_001175 [Amanita brunnescens Koide BX004]